MVPISRGRVPRCRDSTPSTPRACRFNRASRYWTLRPSQLTAGLYDSYAHAGPSRDSQFTGERKAGDVVYLVGRRVLRSRERGVSFRCIKLCLSRMLSGENKQLYRAQPCACFASSKTLPSLLITEFSMLVAVAPALFAALWASARCLHRCPEVPRAAPQCRSPTISERTTRVTAAAGRAPKL